MTEYKIPNCILCQLENQQRLLWLDLGERYLSPLAKKLLRIILKLLRGWATVWFCVPRIRDLEIFLYSEVISNKWNIIKLYVNSPRMAYLKVTEQVLNHVIILYLLSLTYCWHNDPDKQKKLARFRFKYIKYCIWIKLRLFSLHR